MNQNEVIKAFIDTNSQHQSDGEQEVDGFKSFQQYQEANQHLLNLSQE